MKDPKLKHKTKARRVGCIAPGVQEGVLADLARKKPGDPLQPIADRWGVTRRVVHEQQQRHRFEINELREQVAQGGMMLALVADEEIRKKLEDPKAMAETPLRDLAMTRAKLVDSAVTAQEGHSPMIQNNFANVKFSMRALEAMEARRREIKQVAVIQSNP